MDRQTLHDAATNAAGQNQSSHSYSAWRSSQQTQPRILQYQPNPQQPQPQQSQQPQQVLSAQQSAGAGAPGSLDKNIIFASGDPLAQQYNLQNSGPQPQTIFSLHPDPTTASQTPPGPTLPPSTTVPARS